MAEKMAEKMVEKVVETQHHLLTVVEVEEASGGPLVVEISHHLGDEPENPLLRFTKFTADLDNQ